MGRFPYPSRCPGMPYNARSYSFVAPYVIIEVSDTGTGIASDLLPQIFELFVQGQRSLDRSEGGLGIGLSVCRQLTEMHGGYVTGSSEGVGRGATFAIHLPVAKYDGPSRGSIVEKVQAKRRILVVDDNHAAADSTVAILEFDGHQVKAAYTAEAALTQVETYQPDLVLLDIGLPGMSGYEVVQRIKSADPSIYVVAVTGYGRPEDRKRSEAAGFDAHFVKPFDVDALRQIMIHN